LFFLLWFYVSGAALLFSAEINSVIEDVEAAEGEPDAKLKGESPDLPVLEIGLRRRQAGLISGAGVASALHA
jgi:hypothetical protein